MKKAKTEVQDVKSILAKIEQRRIERDVWLTTAYLNKICAGDVVTTCDIGNDENEWW